MPRTSGTALFSTSSPDAERLWEASIRIGLQLLSSGQPLLPRKPNVSRKAFVFELSVVRRPIASSLTGSPGVQRMADGAQLVLPLNA